MPSNEKPTRRHDEQDQDDAALNWWKLQSVRATVVHRVLLILLLLLVLLGIATEATAEIGIGF